MHGSWAARRFIESELPENVERQRSPGLQAQPILLHAVIKCNGVSLSRRQVGMRSQDEVQRFGPRLILAAVSLRWRYSMNLEDPREYEVSERFAFVAIRSRVPPE